MTAKIPVTVITGFLGSGKTTLIRHLLQTSQRRLAVLVNEFGELGIDGDLIRDCRDCTSIIELTNGCVCCTVQDEFLPAMQQLLADRDRIDHILIETSGLALPKPLVTAFRWPEIRQATTVDSVIAIVDAAAVAAGTFAVPAAQQASDHAETSLSELFEDQLACADLVILNKTDQVEGTALARVEHIVRGEIGANVRILRAQHSQLDATILLGLAAAVEDHLEARPSHHDDLHDDHDHDAFSSVEWRSRSACDPQALLGVLEQLLRTYEIYRLKGFVAVPGKAMRWQIQGVGQRLTGYYDQPWGNEPPETRLVLIGMDLPTEAICATLDAVTLSAAH